MVTGKHVLTKSKSREQKNLLFRRNFPWTEYLIHYYVDGAGQIDFGNFDFDYQKRLYQKPTVNLLSSGAVHWKKNLGHNEEESLATYLILSLAVGKSYILRDIGESGCALYHTFYLSAISQPS